MRREVGRDGACDGCWAIHAKYAKDVRVVSLLDGVLGLSGLHTVQATTNGSSSTQPHTNAASQGRRFAAVGPFGCSANIHATGDCCIGLNDQERALLVVFDTCDEPTT